MSVTIDVDLESRSRVDLKTCGVGRYAHDPSTEVLCAAFAVDDYPLAIWRRGEPVPPIFHLATRFKAHNVEFEREMFRHNLSKLGFPVPRDDQWECSAARAAFANRPRSLSALSDVYQLGDAAKDKEGRANMLRLCKPFRGKLVGGYISGGKFDDDPERHAKNEAYCRQDVVAERALFDRLPPLPAKERAVWLLDAKINQRGVPVDLDFCGGAVRTIDRATALGNELLAQITDGLVTTTGQVQKIRAFLEAEGVHAPSLTESDVDELLAGDLPEKSRLVLELRKQLRSAAIKKYAAVLAIADPIDWRARFQLLYYAAATGRWGGRGFQPQNLKRAKPLTDEEIALITAGDHDAAAEYTEGRVFDLLARGVRSIICAPEGKTLVHCDYASIESRTVAWLAGEQRVLDLYAAGKCLYSDMAGKIFGADPEWIIQNKDSDPEAKRQRQVGKVAILGLGYGCGADKFRVIAKSMAGVELSDEEAQNVVSVYRGINKKIVQFWRDMETAAVICVRKRRPVRVGKITYRTVGDDLLMVLPSGRPLYYPKAEITDGQYGGQLSYMNKTRRDTTYGGRLVENVTQAVARDLLADALLRLEQKRLKTVLHVHDSVSVECDEADAERIAAAVDYLMAASEPWAEGLPVDTDTHIGRRMS